jgi:polar amino acid transport system permease protein
VACEYCRTSWVHSLLLACSDSSRGFCAARASSVVPELTLRTQQLTSATFDYFSVYFATGVMYLALTGVLTLVQLLLEDALNLDRRQRRSALSWLVPMPRSQSAPVEPPRDTPPDLAPDAPPRSIGSELIRLTGVRKSYGEHTIFAGVDLSIRSGEVVALLGRAVPARARCCR